TGCRKWHRGGDRPPRRRTLAPSATRGAFLRHSYGHASRRAGLGRTHRRNPRRARLFRDRHHRTSYGRGRGMIDFYYWPTPNGWKVSIMLEECGLPYRVVPVNIGKGDQFKPEFLAISPNNRMPAIVDHDWAGETVSVFESGAILLHLADKAGQF